MKAAGSRRWRNLVVCFVCFCFFAICTPASASLKKAAEIKAGRESQSRTRYEITVELNPETRSYRGTQKVTFRNRQKRSTNYLLFFLYPNDPALTKADRKYMEVSNIRVNGASARIDEKGSFLRIYLAKDFLPGNTVTVDLDFSATLPVQHGKQDLFSQTMDELLKLFTSKSQSETDYGIFSSGKDIMNLGLWYPVLSKFDRDGWDEEKYAGIGDVSYFDPADFRVLLNAPYSHRVVTSGSVIRRTPGKDGRIDYEILAPLSRDFEIEASARYDDSVRLQNGTTIRSSFLPEHRDSGLRALEAATKALEYFEKAFGPYPYTELDIVEAPLFGGAGGVEFPGLVTISSMLYTNPEEAGDDLLKNMTAGNPVFEQLLEFVVAHEVAHQWWNAVVGSNSKKHPFIDEAMANYSAILYFEHYYGREAAERQMALQLKVNYQVHRMMGGNDLPVLQPASAFEGVLAYSAIVYGKGAIYFDELRALLGDALFFSAVRTYYESFWFGIAEPHDFKEIAQKKAPGKSKEIEALYHRWLIGLHGDEDIGPGTLESVLKTVLATDQTVSTDKLEEMLLDLEQIMKEH